MVTPDSTRGLPDTATEYYLRPPLSKPNKVTDLRFWNVCTTPKTRSKQTVSSGIFLL